MRFLKKLSFKRKKAGYIADKPSILSDQDDGLKQENIWKDQNILKNEHSSADERDDSSAAVENIEAGIGEKEEKIEQSSDVPDQSGGNDLLFLIKKFKKNRKLRESLENGIRHFGSNPVPKILEEVILDPESEGTAMCSMWLAYIGQSAIPYLLDLLRHEDFHVAKFSARTLAGIEGSLPHVVDALRDHSRDVRLHAAGSLQDFGVTAEPAISSICDCLITEEDENIGSIAASALGKIGEKALPAVRRLLEDPKPKVRIRGIYALSRMGSKALALRALYEIRVKENDEKVMKLVDIVGRELTGDKPNELLLPVNIAGPMIGLVEGISMQPLQIDYHILDKFKKEGDEMVRSLIDVNLSEKITSAELGILFFETMGERGIQFLINLFGNEDRALGRYACDCLTAIGLPSLPHLQNALRSTNINTQEHASGALLRLAVKKRREEIKQAIPGLTDLIKNQPLDLWDITVLASAALGEIGEGALATIRELLYDPKSLVRLATVAALLRMGGESALSALREAREIEQNFSVMEAIDYAMLRIVEKRL